MTRPTNRQQAAAAARQQAAAAVAMAGAVDLAGLKERADAQRAQAQRGPISAPPGAATAPAGDAPATGGSVIDVTEATFEAEVLNRSMAQLVLVDLWAAWSEASTQMTAVLESLAARSDGRWVVAKVDVDANPRIAQAFRAQSLPMVLALVQGQPVTAINEVHSAAETSAWIEDILAQVGHLLTGAPEAPAEAAPEDPRMAAAEQKMAADDLDGALAAYRAIVEADPGNVEAASAARSIEFLLRAQAHDPAIVDTAAPGDIDAQLAAADVLLLGSQAEDAFDRIIAVVKVTNGDDRTRARTRLLELFELFEPADPRVVAARRKLASALY